MSTSRGYRQIGVIFCVAMLVLIFFLGILEKIPWNYAIGTITLTGVIGALIKFYPLKIKSEKKEEEASIQKEGIKEVLEQHRKAETVSLRENETKTKESVLLLDSTEIIKLNINSDLLNQIYEQSRHHQAIDKYPDAQLSNFSIVVHPFWTYHKVTIYLKFYSKEAEKMCSFRFSDISPLVEHYLPDKVVKEKTKVFATLPWNKSPQWKQFLTRVYARIGPFPPIDSSFYTLIATPPEGTYFDWWVQFDDDFSGRTYTYGWNGGGIDENSIRQLG